MSRPLRIKFSGAWYHVMNRGLARQNIFHNNEHRKLFLQTLKEACEMFSLEIHSYCLMSNHYHLLIRTPEGNISRAMRHIGGVYTQRYNSITKSDGKVMMMK